MTGPRPVSGLGAIDPTLVTQLIQAGTTVASSSIDLAKSVQERKASEAQARQQRKAPRVTARPQQYADDNSGSSPPPSSPLIPVLLGGALGIAAVLTFRALRSTPQSRGTSK
jgi:hypothetical protein